jgi:hypothetical protein
MKASELIQRLERAIKQHGDHEVVFPSEAESTNGDTDVVQIHNISIGFDENNTAYQFLICDKETALSFS